MGEVRRLLRHELEKIDEVLALLRGPEWPRDEIRPRDDFIARFLGLVPGAAEMVVIVFEQGGGVAGALVGHLLPLSRSALCEYLAVAAEARGRGIGAALYSAFREAAGSASFVLLEYEPPVTADAFARAEWWARRGVVATPWRYVQPSYGLFPAKEMTLAIDARGPVEPGEIREAVLDVYRGVYGLAEDDPLCGRMRAGIQ